MEEMFEPAFVADEPNPFVMKACGVPVGIRNPPFQARSIPRELSRLRAPAREENVSDAVQPSEFQR